MHHCCMLCSNMLYLDDKIIFPKLLYILSTLIFQYLYKFLPDVYIVEATHVLDLEKQRTRVMTLKATKRETYYLIMGVGTSWKSMTKNIERLAKIMPMVELGSNKSSFDFFTWGESKPVAIQVYIHQPFHTERLHDDIRHCSMFPSFGPFLLLEFGVFVVPCISLLKILEGGDQLVEHLLEIYELCFEEDMLLSRVAGLYSKLRFFATEMCIDGYGAESHKAAIQDIDWR
ncbi:hypothetical protein KFK09_003927 [Dendrobium nobile]|uniref:Uncharacterized protein n=1 Tax=Dendrobium nobile TaxID=94219 RepID=A0A8T3C1G3_DENNO|nr:hypothetical protein KFK09_003927 [Dendrobium nobile]